MANAEIDPGYCIGFGATNARIANYENGDIYGFETVDTPKEPDDFFTWMARKLLIASSEGKTWLVAGFPGPVSPDGRVVGPLKNVQGMRNTRYDLRDYLSDVDPEVGRVLEQGFTLIAVNDGTLAAHAAASRIGLHEYQKTGAIIIGTGVGAGIVEKDPSYPTVYRADNKHPLEVGHIQLSLDPQDTFENNYSGTAIENRYGDPKKLAANHQAWKDIGGAIGRIAQILGLTIEPNLLVPTGGVGAGASDKLSEHIERFYRRATRSGIEAQKLFMPEIKYVPPKEANEFEMYGAEGVMRDFLTQRSD